MIASQSRRMRPASCHAFNRRPARILFQPHPRPSSAALAVTRPSGCDRSQASPSASSNGWAWSVSVMTRGNCRLSAGETAAEIRRGPTAMRRVQAGKRPSPTPAGPETVRPRDRRTFGRRPRSPRRSGPRRSCADLGERRADRRRSRASAAPSARIRDSVRKLALSEIDIECIANPMGRVDWTPDGLGHLIRLHDLRKKHVRAHCRIWWRRSDRRRTKLQPILRDSEWRRLSTRVTRAALQLIGQFARCGTLWFSERGLRCRFEPGGRLRSLAADNMISNRCGHSPSSLKCERAML